MIKICGNPHFFSKKVTFAAREILEKKNIPINVKQILNVNHFTWVEILLEKHSA